MDSNLVPTTAIAAVVIFFLRELIEGFRRKGANDRKRLALRKFLAGECELNNGAVKGLRRDLEIAIEAGLGRGGAPAELSIFFSEGGRVFLLSRKDGVETQWGVPLAHKEQMERYAFDAAVLDKRLFGKVEPAIDAVSELLNIRTGLIDHVLHPQQYADVPGHVTAFCDYGLGVIDRSYAALDALYQECTGRKLETYRVR